MSKADDEFHDFVVSFADPLSRLAFVLTAGSVTDEDAAAGLGAQLANDAMAQTRRRWREVETTGAPEPIAVEVLVSGVMKRRRGRRSDAALAADARDAIGAPNGEMAAADDVAQADPQLLRTAVWTAFEGLPPRERVPLVFADPSAASRRLDGIEMPAVVGSPRKHDALAESAVGGIRRALRADPALRAAPASLESTETLSQAGLVRLVSDVLRDHAGAAPQTIDPYPAVVVRLRQIRRQAAALATTVVVLLGVCGVVAVKVSTPKKSAASRANAAALANLAHPSATPRSSEPPLPAVVLPIAAPAPTDPEQPVVSWPTRGSAAGDVALVAQVEANFLEEHPDATTQAQVLAITDTPAFRFAYVTANSPNGVLQSWFAGPVGSTDLVEAAFSYGGSLLPTSVLADEVAAPDGRTELIVIGPPNTTAMQIADLAIGASKIGFVPLAFTDGIGMQDLGLTPRYDIAVNVSVGSATYPAQELPTVQLQPTVSFDTGSAQLQHPSPAPSVLLERGTADPALVAQALIVAAAWEQPVPSAPTQPVVLWGGTDAVGTKLAVVRDKTKMFDLLIIEWSGDAPGLHGEVEIDSASPDVPVAFAYRGLAGARIGVLGAPGDAAAALEFKGAVSPVATFDDTGFLSIPVTGVGGLPSSADPNASPPPSNDFTGLVDASVDVRVLDSIGQLRELLTAPPTL